MGSAGRPALQLLQRPVRRQPAAKPGRAPRESVGQWVVRQVERFWAWGETAQHHRLGSWLQH
ncbi:MAG: hypothetical protein AB1430_16225 [Pseudomonadota bacterium]